MTHLSVRHSGCSALVAFITLGHVPAWHLSARNAPAGSSVSASAHVYPATHARARITLLLAHLDADLGMPELTDTDTHLAFISTRLLKGWLGLTVRHQRSSRHGTLPAAAAHKVPASCLQAPPAASKQSCTGPPRFVILPEHQSACTWAWHPAGDQQTQVTTPCSAAQLCTCTWHK